MMIPNWVSRTVREYHAGRSLALIFDYDGTLTPIVSHPSLAVLPGANRDSLATLAALDRITVGIISGRALEVLKGFVDLPNLKYAGSGGMQLDLDSQRFVDGSLAEFERVSDSISTALTRHLEAFPETWIERKPGCLTVHYRALPPLNAVWFVQEVRDCIGQLSCDSGPLRVREVTRSLEITLAGSWTKGDAIEWMLGGQNRELFALFAGDGANDAEAMEAVNARGGLTIGIGNEAPACAQLHVETPQEFAAGLACLTRELKSGQPQDDFTSSTSASCFGS